MYDDDHPVGLLEMSNAQYHSSPGISSTQVKVISQSPLAYWDAYINPDREPREYKHAFAVGDGTHKLVLEPGTFEQTYAVGFDKAAYPDALDTVADLKKACGERGLQISGSKTELVDRLLADGVPPERITLALQRQHEAAMAGRIPIPATDYKAMLSMLRAVSADPIASGLLAGATCEESYFWRDHNGVLRKCRTDLVTADGAFVVDLKTTDDVSRDGFGRTIANFGYHVSAAWYLDVLNGLYGSDAPQGFAFIAAQKRRPYDVAVHYLTEPHLRLGRMIYRRNLTTLMECYATGRWPGVARGEVIEANLPTWEMRKLELFEGEALL